MDTNQKPVSETAINQALQPLGQVIRDCIGNPHRTGENEGYRLALCLIPLWLEIRPPDVEVQSLISLAESRIVKD